MDKTSNLPLALWQANLDLQMRLGQLLQDGGRQWLEQGTRTAGEGAAEFDAQARKLLQAGDWPALAALPMETFWRQAGQAGDGKAAAQTALQAQQEFVGGLAEALQDWQRQSAKAWSAASIDAGAVPGIDGSWQAMQSNLEQAIAAMMQTGAGGAGSRKRGG
ncbi:MAG TPA: phasin family protein [Luteimonas sp.]|nr:phasin family protein [Luteimonas sp.]